MKKFCVIILALIMMLSAGIFGMTVAGADSVPIVSAGNVSGFAGDTVDVPVVISGNPGITALSFDVSYDSTRIRLVSATDGAILGTSTATFGNDVSLIPYTLCWDDLSTENNTGNGTVAILKFSILNGATGTAEISLSLNRGSTFNVDFEDVAFETVNGSVSITPVSLYGISVQSNPTKTEYYVGDTFNSDGLALTAIYNNGTTETVTNGFACTPGTFDEAGEQTVTVSYGGKNTQITVTVEDRECDYTVRFVSDGEVISEETYSEGETITVPEVRGKSGYIFRGWEPRVPETMPAENMTFTAVFEKMEVTTNRDEDTPKDNDTDSTNGTNADEVKIKATVSIRNNGGSKTINYGEILRLTAATTDMPDNAKLYWYVDGVKKGEGKTFDVAFENGTRTVEVKLVDMNGNILKNADGNEISDSEEVTVKAGFLQKLIAFFKNLFGLNQTVVQTVPKGEN